jgi:hypothetical protein
MSRPLSPYLFPILLLSSLPAQAGLIAAVDDPMSHGTVGDPRLSLDEAIRLASGSLSLGQLSAGEAARLSGSGTLVQRIVVDAAVTPAITLQAPLADVDVAPGPHYHVEIEGMPAGNGALPVIQGGSHPRVFTLRTYNCSLHGLHVMGGQVGVDARMPQPPAPPPHMAHVMHCELGGQTTACVRAHATGTDESMLMLEHCRLHNAPVGFQLDDQATGGMVMVEAEHVAMDGVALGCRVQEAGSGANMSMFVLFRSSFTNGTTLAEKRRTPLSTQQFMFRIVFVDAQCSGHVLDCQGAPSGLTMVHHHHSDFVAGPGQKAFWCWPRTAQFDVHGSEMAFAGDVEIGTNLASPRFWQQNNSYRNGTVTIDADGALPNLLWNRYENCTIAVPATARSPVAIRGGHLVNTAVQAASFLAPVTLQGCWRSGGSLSGFATEQQPAPAAFLGDTEVTPAEPQVGTSVQLATDLPAGIGLVWDVALSIPRPTTTMEPVRFYGDPATAIVLPAFVLYQSQMTVPLPNAPALAGIELYVQGISLPLFGQPWAPVYHLPRGQLVLLRP